MSLLNKIKSFSTKKEDKIIKPTKPKEFGILLNIASVFSILFSMSVLSALQDSDILTLIILGAFLLVIFIVNERQKVSSIEEIGYLNKKLLFEKNEEEEEALSLDKTPKQRLQSSKFVAAITILLSLSSIYGVYTLVINNVDKIEQETSSNSINIEAQYTKSIDSLSYLLNKVDSLTQIDNPTIFEEYEIVKNKLKANRFSSIAEKEEANEEKKYLFSKIEELNKEKKQFLTDKIKKIELDKKSKLGSIEETSNKSSNKTLILSGILCLLSFIVEAAIFFLANSKGNTKYIFEAKMKEYEEKVETKKRKEMDELLNNPIYKQFLDYMRVVNSIYVLKKQGDKITKKVIQDNSTFNNAAVDKFRNLLMDIGIIAAVTNTETKIVLGKEDAIQRLDEYFTKLYEM